MKICPCGRMSTNEQPLEPPHREFTQVLGRRERVDACMWAGAVSDRHMLSADTRAVQVEFWAFPMPVHFPQESPVSSGVAQNTGLEPDRLGSAL